MSVSRRNPTGSIISATELRAAITRLGLSSPETTVVVGEAYHEYVETPEYATAAREAVSNPRVIVNRTFSKLYALAGLRLGYLIGHAETLKRVARDRVAIGASVPGIAAGTPTTSFSASIAISSPFARPARRGACRSAGAIPPPTSGPGSPSAHLTRCAAHFPSSPRYSGRASGGGPVVAISTGTRFDQFDRRAAVGSRSSSPIYYGGIRPTNTKVRTEKDRSGAAYWRSAVRVP